MRFDIDAVAELISALTLPSTHRQPRPDRQHPFLRPASGLRNLCRPWPPQAQLRGPRAHSRCPLQLQPYPQVMIRLCTSLPASCSSFRLPWSNCAANSILSLLTFDLASTLYNSSYQMHYASSFKSKTTAPGLTWLCCTSTMTLGLANGCHRWSRCLSWQCDCSFGGGNGGSADDDERKVEHSVKPMLRSSSSAKFCCHFHHLSSADLPDCEAIPLCGHCILHTGCLEPVRTANQAAAIRLCKQAGHPVSADEMCFKLWTALRSPDSQPCSSAAEVRRVLSNPPELVKRLSSLYKEVKLLDERLVLIKSNQDKHFEDLSQVRSGYDVLSRRVTQLDRRFSDFEGNMKESLVPSRFVFVMSSV